MIFGVSNWVGGGVIAEMEKIWGGAGVGEKISSGREVID